MGRAAYHAVLFAQLPRVIEMPLAPASGTAQLSFSSKLLSSQFLHQELVPMALELGLGITPWSPLKGGVLRGEKPY
jgi:aryl-alcohol dehydrogenase-like predicted oxidoreductase